MLSESTTKRTPRPLPSLPPLGSMGDAMGAYSMLVRPLLFRTDPEWIHHQSIRAGQVLGRCGRLPRLVDVALQVDDPRLATSVAGIRYANPLGLAAGYDKSGEAIPFLESLGFSHVEIGSVSASPSRGNPRPRLFRLPADEAIVVHYGLQNDGAERIAERLRRIRHRRPLGINIVTTNRGPGAPPDAPEAIFADYRRSVHLLKDLADHLTLNLSCPNTAHGRDFFAEPGMLRTLLAEVGAERPPCPVFLKLSPLGSDAWLDLVLEAADAQRWIAGFAFNLAPGKVVPLRSDPTLLAAMPGAVAGRPVRDLLDARLSALYRRMDRRRYRIIGIGGVASAVDAYRKIRLGASLVQLLTALVYRGPGVARSINRGLARLLAADGFGNVAEAVGTAHEGC